MKFEIENNVFFFLLLRQNFSKFPKSFFPKGLTHAFGQKIQFFSLFVIGQKRTRNKV